MKREEVLLNRVLRNQTTIMEAMTIILVRMGRSPSERPNATIELLREASHKTYEELF